MIKNTFLAGLIGLVAFLASCDGKPAMASCLLDADVCGSLTGLDDENFDFIGNGLDIQDVISSGFDITADSDATAVLIHRFGLGEAGVFSVEDFERVAFVYGDNFIEFDNDSDDSFRVNWDFNNPPQVLLTDSIIRVGVSKLDRRDIPEPRVWLALGMIAVGAGITKKSWK